jgi:hypothetical protein
MRKKVPSSVCRGCTCRDGEVDGDVDGVAVAVAVAVTTFVTTVVTRAGVGTYEGVLASELVTTEVVERAVARNTSCESPDVAAHPANRSVAAQAKMLATRYIWLPRFRTSLRLVLADTRA